jgi:hypothetical protein
MIEGHGDSLSLSHVEVVAIYVALIDAIDSLDEVQSEALDKISSKLYEELSVEEMEHIDLYYENIKGKK